MEVFLCLLICSVKIRENLRRFGNWLCFRHEVKPHSVVSWVHWAQGLDWLCILYCTQALLSTFSAFPSSTTFL
jgi:hypothetical protein